MRVFGEEDCLPLSALQHLLFCERQCALIHVEGQWTENRLTAEGRVLHARAHDGADGTRGGVRVTRGMALRSLRLGVTGRSDVVEWRGDGDRTVPYPVEYKRGRAKRHRADEVQLCAQAMCLEEACGVSVPEGALYYGAVRRRVLVPFDSALRTLTDETARRLHDLVDSGRTPRAMREPKCDACSLLELCLPGVTGARSSAAAFVTRELAAGLAGVPTDGAEP